MKNSSRSRHSGFILKVYSVGKQIEGGYHHAVPHRNLHLGRDFRSAVRNVAVLQSVTKGKQGRCLDKGARFSFGNRKDCHQSMRIQLEIGEHDYARI